MGHSDKPTKAAWRATGDGAEQGKAAEEPLGIYGAASSKLDDLIHLHCAAVKAECFGFLETACVLREMRAELLRDAAADRHSGPGASSARSAPGPSKP